MSRVWYVAYGANLNADRMRNYLSKAETDARYPAGAVESRWVQLDQHRLYFAGVSKTWGGAVAFCALVRTQARPYPGRAYALTAADLAAVLAAENGLPLGGWDLAEVDVPVGGLAVDSLGARRAGAIAYETAVSSGISSVLVDEQAIGDARRQLWEDFRIVVEHGTATAQAALLSGAYRPAVGERVVVVLCGANANPADLA